MTTITAARSGPIRWKSRQDGQLGVEKENHARFIDSAARAVESSGQVIKEEEYARIFEDRFLGPLYRWCSQFSHRVRNCYVTFQGDHIQVFVVTNRKQYDFDLSKEIAALELNLVGGGWEISVTQLPDSDDASLHTYFHPELSLEVYANG